ncbi:MAG: GTPase domain-containing protein [Kofleriaceae bacterium]|nr:GTPase domain-containing protein [Kofleriaceae bacterium]
MAQVDFHERQLTLKLVYYGPPLSGKTTNLRALHGRVDALNRGRLMTLDTRDDRTLFFDLLPLFFRAGSVSIRLKVYTVPGQPMHEWTRRIVLQRADGVVFVADSSVTQATANREAWDGLSHHLGALRLDHVPVVVQYNKRDLPDRVEMASADRFGDPHRPLMEAQAVSGVGVVETFFATLERTWDVVDADVRLAERFGIERESFLDAMRAHIGADQRSTTPVLSSAS